MPYRLPAPKSQDVPWQRVSCSPIQAHKASLPCWGAPPKMPPGCLSQTHARDSHTQPCLTQLPLQHLLVCWKSRFGLKQEKKSHVSGDAQRDFPTLGFSSPSLINISVLQWERSLRSPEQTLIAVTFETHCSSPAPALAALLLECGLHCSATKPPLKQPHRAVKQPRRCRAHGQS